MNENNVSSLMQKMDDVRGLVHEAQETFRLPLLVLLLFYSISSFALLFFLFLFLGLEIAYQSPSFGLLSVIPALVLLMGWALLGFSMYRFLLLFRREIVIRQWQREKDINEEALGKTSNRLDYFTSSTSLTMNSLGNWILQVTLWLVLFWLSVIMIAFVMIVSRSFYYMY